MKRCPDCGKYKPLDEFPRNKRKPDGRHAYCKPCHNARGRETKERLYGGSRHYHLKRRYGIGASEFDQLVSDQGGVCPICTQPDPEHVDHDHATGRVRGILCFNCNGGLGQFGDDAERLVRAQLYLEWSDMTLDERTRSSDRARERARALRGSAA
jgi:Recombination endonuclease VII